MELVIEIFLIIIFALGHRIEYKGETMSHLNISNATLYNGDFMLFTRILAYDVIPF